MLRQIANYIRNNRGQSLVELALAIPILLMVAMGIIDFGRVYNQMLTVNQAAREAARVAAVSGDAAKALTAARNYGANLTINVSPAPPVSGQNVTVTVTSTVTFITPLIGSFFNSSNYIATGTAIMQVE